jgi:hypothetical protein
MHLQPLSTDEVRLSHHNPTSMPTSSHDCVISSSTGSTAARPAAAAAAPPSSRTPDAPTACNQHRTPLLTRTACLATAVCRPERGCGPI